MDTYMRTSALIASLLLGITVGWVANQYKHLHDHLECNDYNTKHSKWTGYIAKEINGDLRCFWLEQEFPNRIRQGVPV